MARNKYPEQTIAKILDTSLHLFLKKGYDKTTIQDIVNELGMSKGAIYHHFKSKEEILNALGDHYYDVSNDFSKIKNRDELNGLEKIREIFRLQMSNENKTEMDSVMINVWKDPRFFMMSMEENMSQSAKFLEPLLLEGMEDGSIRPQNTTCASQILIMLLNFWVFSPLTGFKTDDLQLKLHYLRELCEGLGIPIITDELENMAHEYFISISSSI